MATDTTTVKSARVSYFIDDAKMPFFIKVKCPRCGEQPDFRPPWLLTGATTKGCLLCGPLLDALVPLFERPEFVGLFRLTRNTPGDVFRRGMLADWLDDHGYYELGHAVRLSAMQMTAAGTRG